MVEHCEGACFVGHVFQYVVSMIIKVDAPVSTSITRLAPLASTVTLVGATLLLCFGSCSANMPFSGVGHVFQYVVSMIIKVDTTENLSELLKHHNDVFKDELGLVEAASAKIHVDSTTQPIFCKPRSVPYALKGRIEQELKRLGDIEPVQFANWAAPVVPVVKKDGSIHICGDFKVTINRATKVDSYPLPKVEDLLASL